MGWLLPLYLRREPTTDELVKRYGFYRRDRFPKDVVAYRDPECRRIACRWPWHYSTKPRKTRRRVMFNCYEWAAHWLPDKEV